MAIIQGGTGLGYSAKVNSDNRLYTFASSVPAGVIAAANKKMWLVISGDLTYTTDAESAVLYLRYTGVNELVISQYNLTIGESTGGTGLTSFTTYANPTAGTLISDQTAATISNRNFSGTSGSLPGVQYVGGQGKTITGGATFGTLKFPEDLGVEQVSFETVPIVLEGGNSLAITCTPPAGNTSQINRVSIICYELVVE